MKKHIYNLGIRQIQKLRKQIALCSIYLADYVNTYEIDENETSDFFDGFADYLTELMQENEKDYNGYNFFDLLPKYDNAENLKEYFYNYCCGFCLLKHYTSNNRGGRNKAPYLIK